MTNTRRALASAALVAALWASFPTPSRAENRDPRDAAGLYQGVTGRLDRVGAGEMIPAGLGAAVAESSRELPAPQDSGQVKSGPSGQRTAELRRGGPKIGIPAGAKPFMPDYMSKASPDSLWALDSAVTQKIASELAGHFARFYPDVVYHVDWEDEKVNAYAWREGDTRHVALLGGLLRNKSLQREGIGLVLAHELGHHYGGTPTYSSGLSCEGQADYWAALTGMRRIWGDEYRAQMLPAVAQITAFFSHGVRHELTEDEEELASAAAGGCGHPPAACRRQTYEAAMEGKPKPECAGPTGAVASADALRTDQVAAAL